MALKFERLPAPSLPGLDFSEMESWGARSNGYSFLISCDRGHNQYTPGHDEWRASWKNSHYSGPQSANQIDGSPFRTRIEAEEACKLTWRQLIRKT